MKYKNGFSIAEVTIVAVFMGVIAAITLPAMNSNMAVKQRLYGYKEAYNKVQQVLDSLTDNGKTPICSVPKSDRIIFAREECGRKIWKELSDTLPVVGYIAQGDNTYTLKPAAKWGGGDTCEPDQEECKTENATVTVGTGSAASNTIHQASPWIVTQSGMAFSVNVWKAPERTSINGATYNDCVSGATLEGLTTTNSNIVPNGRTDDNGKKVGLQSVREQATLASCVFITVDINGLDKRPNRLASGSLIDRFDMEKEVEKADRFYIYTVTGTDGKGAFASRGPARLTEYWMYKRVFNKE